MTAAFVAQSGKTAAETKPLAVAGCTPTRRASPRGSRACARAGRDPLRVTAAAGAPELRQVRVLLPNALEAKPSARASAWRRHGRRRAAPHGDPAHRDGELRVTLPAGTRTVTATLAKGAVRAGRKLRRAKPPKRLRFRVSVRDGDGPRPVRTLKVRPKRR